MSVWVNVVAAVQTFIIERFFLSFMTLLLRKMGIILWENKPHCHSRLSKPILNILSILGKQLSQAMFSKYVFRLLHAPKSQISSTKLNMMVKVVKLFTVFYEKAALMNFTRKHLYGSLFFNKVSRIQAKKRPMHRCLPVSFTEYFRTLFLQNTSG